MKFTCLLIPVLPALLSTVHADSASTSIPPTLPAPVASFGAAATHDGHVFIYGGHAGVRHKYSKDDVNGNLHAWKAGEESWSPMGADEPAQGASLVALPGKVIRIGGMAARNAKDEKQDLWSSETAASYDLATKQWSQLPKLPARRSSHDSAVIGNTLYVVGGWVLTGGGSRSSMPEWHGTYLTLDLSMPEAGWKTHEQPFKRRALAVQAIGTKLYAIGGMTDQEEPTTAVDILETTTGVWSKGPALPEDKLGGFGFSAVAHEDRLFASGAAGELIELRTDKWMPILKLAHPRFFHRLLPGGPGKLIALGGESRKGEKAPPEIISLPSGNESKLPAETPKAAALLPASPEPSWPNALPATESDWPGYQGPRGNCTTPEVGWNTRWPADGPVAAWKVNLGVGLSSFAVVGGRVYSSGNDGQGHETLVCLELKTGQNIWRQQIIVATKAHEMPIVPNGPGSTPTVVKDLAWFICREGDLLCLNALNGSPAWKKHLIHDLGGKRPVYGYTSSPCVHDGRLYLDIGGDEKSTTCLNADNGEILWQTGKGEAGYSTPQIIQRAGKDILVMFKGEALELRTAKDGILLANHQAATRDFCNCATPVIAGEAIFISHTGNIGARTLDWNGAAILTERWSDKGLGLLFHSGLPWGQNLLAFNDELRGRNELRLIDLANGQPRWLRTDIPKGTGLLTDDGHAILLTNTGEIILSKVSAKGLDILAQFQSLKPKAWCQPVLSHRHLLVKNNDGEVVCYQL